MAKGPENTFIASVHRHLPDGLYWMKNHNQYVGGIADVWYSGPKGDLWVEYKFITVPKRDDTLIDFGLSELQKEWLSARYREGRNVVVIVGSKEGGVMWTTPAAWENKCTAATFRELSTSRSGLADFITRRTQ